MVTFAYQVLSLVLLFLVVWLGWKRWCAAEWPGYDRQQKGLAILFLMTFAGAVVGAPFWWADVAISFSWDLPPLASRLLGAAALAFAAACIVMFESRDARCQHMALIMLVLYLGPIVGAALFLHMDRFDFATPVTYAFFVIAAGLLAGALWHVLRGTRLPAKEADDAALTGPYSAWLGATGLLTGLWGIALFAVPAWPTPLVFIWATDPLTSRLIASMLITLGGTGLLSLTRATATFSLVVLIVYGIGVVVAGLLNGPAGKPIPALYVLFFAVMAIVSAVLLHRKVKLSQ